MDRLFTTSTPDVLLLFPYDRSATTAQHVYK